MTLILEFQGQSLKHPYFRNERAHWHGMKGMWIDCSWPWAWPLCSHDGVGECAGYSVLPIYRGRVYRGIGYIAIAIVHNALENGVWFWLKTVTRYIALSLISRYHCLDPTSRDISRVHCSDRGDLRCWRGVDIPSFWYTSWLPPQFPWNLLDAFYTGTHTDTFFFVLIDFNSLRPSDSYMHQ